MPIFLAIRLSTRFPFLNHSKAAQTPGRFDNHRSLEADFLAQSTDNICEIALILKIWLPAISVRASIQSNAVHISGHIDSGNG